MNYSLEIIKEGVGAAGDFDGSTALDLSLATVDASEAGRIIVTIPTGVAMGSFFPGEILQRGKSATGLAYFMSEVSMDRVGALNASDVVRRRAPGAPSTQVEELVDLQATQGFPEGKRFLFQADHAMEILTTNGGVHKLKIIIKQATNADLRRGVVEA